MTQKWEGMVTLGDVLEDIGHELRPHDCGRWDVRRTRHHEERQPIPGWKRQLVYKRDHFRCVWCGYDRNLQLDHIRAWSAGGGEDIDNLRTLCRKCNSYRSNRGFCLDLMAAELTSGEECVNCSPSLVLGNPLAEPIFCVYCQEPAVGLSCLPGFTADQRNYKIGGGQ